MTQIILPKPANHTLFKKCEGTAKKMGAFSPGEHPWKGRVVLDVDTVVKKGQNSTYTTTVKVNWKNIAVAALQRAGFQRNAIIEMLAEAAKDAVKEDESVESIRVEISEEAELLLNQIVGSLPLATRSGTTTVKGEIVVVEVTEAS